MSKLDQKTVDANVDVELTEPEIIDRLNKCASNIERLAKVKERFKDVKKQWTSDIKALELEISDLAAAANTGREWRNVTCNRVWDLPNKETWVEYKGVRYQARAMQDYEVAQVKQQPLFNDGANLPDTDKGLKAIQ